MPTKPQTKFHHLKVFTVIFTRTAENYNSDTYVKFRHLIQSNMICGLNIHIPPNSAAVLSAQYFCKLEHKTLDTDADFWILNF